MTPQEIHERAKKIAERATQKAISRDRRMRKYDLIRKAAWDAKQPGFVSGGRCG